MTSVIESTASPRPARRPGLGSRGTFWSAAAVLALCLWSSGAPSVLYPLYADRWTLTPAVTTAVFGTYPLALIVALVLFGGLSDAVGRRRAMLIGVALIASSAIVFALAPSVGFLFAGRVLQGVGTGIALGAASAALVEHNVSSNPRFASSMATVATSTGLTLALIVSGALAQLVPLPLVISYLVLLVLGAGTLAALWATPDDRPAQGARWRPQPLRVPRGIRRTFAIATLSVSIAYCVGAIFLSLGAQMVRQFAATTDMLVVGVLLGTSSLAIGATALLLARVPAHVAVWTGAILSIGSLGLMAAVAATGSIALFLVWCLLGGVAYSFAFTGGLGLINRAAPAQHRGATLSVLYLFAYLLQALTAIGAGALATAVGLGPAVDIMAPVLGLLCAAVLVISIIDVALVRRVAEAV
ncbi:Major Facilitator Superfamily protein [Microbacterium sp. cf046]|uniref:MFS transporter n=1 Tax=Microbacterium sp. cf046 TaxID=1761803 RepID=UPI0008E1A2DF|nr:MFS transporter [Microbacterium sp. cf046]SFR92841.1 Major Facilitator Superfamily protein [Microbacterium sp. cf046]